MSIKSPQTLVSEALNEVKTITPEEAMKLNSENKCNLIDIRDGVELEKLGAIENSFHIPRGLLEFSIHPDSAYIQNNQIDLNKETVLFCAAGGRSALAAKTLKEMGFKNVSHVEGGFGLMIQKGFKTKT
jgi:rhodanese-related sulfurtransferase